MRTVLFASLLCICMVSIAQNACITERYKKEVFSAVTKTSQVYYGTATPYGLLAQPQDLYIDIYEPTGDTLAERPVMVYAFGGAFLVGEKNQPPIPTYCEAFAKMGYVVVAIDYRIGFNLVSTESVIRAVYRASQDLRAAVRHLCQRHQQYRIDTASIILTGSSAGCFAGLHSTYFEESQRPIETYGVPLENTDLGCFDCSGNTDFNKRLPKIKAIVNHWGALLDTLLIQNEPDENCPVISFHGTTDNLVPYETGNPFSYPVFPEVQGSVPIHKRLTNLGIKNKLVPLDGYGHEPWLTATNLLDTAYKYTSAFLYEAMMPAPQKLTADTVVCMGAAIDVAAIVNNRSIYCWDIRGNATLQSDNGSSLNLLSTDTGLITITLTEQNYLGMHGEQAAIRIKVLPRPNAAFNSVVTNGLQVAITDSSTNRNNVSWDLGNGVTFNTPLTTYTYPAPGDYIITQIAANNACADTFFRMISVDTCPEASFSYQLSGDSLILSADSSNAQSFEWNVNGTNVQGRETVVIVTEKATFPVQLTVTNRLDCSDAIIQFINTNLSGINSTIDNELKVYPNPIRSNLNIITHQASAADYIITDLLGNTAKQGSFSNQTTLDLNHLSAGSYFIKLYIAGNAYEKKLLVIK